MDKKQSFLLGKKLPAYQFQEGIALDDAKIQFVLKYVKGKSVLDLGCVQHNPENCKSKYWLHKAIKSYAQETIGLDLYKEGVDYLNEKGFNITHGNAENFQFNQKFDVIVAGDLIEHLSNAGNMLECAKKHIKQNGYILIVTPNPWYWRFLLKAILFSSARPNPEHTCWFCLDTLTHLLSRYDLDIHEFDYATVLYGFNIKKWIDILLPLPKLLKYNSLHICAISKNNDKNV